MNVLETVSAVREFRRSVTGRLGLVPTMGALHDGHLSLVRLAREQAGAVLVSIYVNPTQFNSTTDFQVYPRTLEKDLEMLESMGVAAVFRPADVLMYPEGFATTVKVTGLTEIWEGIFRPGHLDGVAMVVTKLLNITTPDLAYFGEKDYQQLLLVRKLVRDLDMAVEIVPGPTIRNPSGLALSSRNALLSPEERQLAPGLKRTLDETAQAIQAGRAVNDAIKEGITTLTGLGFKVDYLALADGTTLETLTAQRPGARLIVAAHLGRVRLIDNRAL
ncbi:MAG: pantoate--beta-alanine ligase [Candidatus Neomarinimicrobiota bacterium]